MITGIRLPMRDGFLENIEVAEASLPSRTQINGFLHPDSNGCTQVCFLFVQLENFYFLLHTSIHDCKTYQTPLFLTDDLSLRLFTSK